MRTACIVKPGWQLRPALRTDPGKTDMQFVEAWGLHKALASTYQQVLQVGDPASSNDQQQFICLADVPADADIWILHSREDALTYQQDWDWLLSSKHRQFYCLHDVRLPQVAGWGKSDRHFLVTSARNLHGLTSEQRQMQIKFAPLELWALQVEHPILPNNTDPVKASLCFHVLAKGDWGPWRVDRFAQMAMQLPVQIIGPDGEQVVKGPYVGVSMQSWFAELLVTEASTAAAMIIPNRVIEALWHGVPVIADPLLDPSGLLYDPASLTKAKQSMTKADLWLERMLLWREQVNRLNRVYDCQSIHDWPAVWRASIQQIV